MMNILIKNNYVPINAFSNAPTEKKNRKGKWQYFNSPEPIRAQA